MSDPGAQAPRADSVPLSPSVADQSLALGSSGLTIVDEPRELRMHRVTEEELTTLRGVVPTTSIAFLGIAIGSAVSFGTVLESSGLRRDTRSNFEAFYLWSRWATLFFVIITLVSYVHLWSVIRRVKTRPSPRRP